MVFDKDLIGSDDLLGQIVLELKDFEDGKEQTITRRLRDEV
jgi:hypothetical protein